LFRRGGGAEKEPVSSVGSSLTETLIGEISSRNGLPLEFMFLSSGVMKGLRGLQIPRFATS